MLDYKGIEALYTVLEQQSFELAAKKLFITQSAISQRIKGLESFYKEPLLIRTLPYRPTKLGEFLLGHYKRLRLLEDALRKQIESAEIKPRLSIALNRDSLETWFQDILDHKTLFKELILEIIADDQELTIEYLKKGLVSACLSTQEKAIIGGNAEFLGNMEYLLVASPDFVRRFFTGKNTKKLLIEAPAIKYDQNDRLHERYLEKYFHIQNEELSFHLVPSVQGFKKFALQGYGYGLIPKIDIIPELKKKKLIQLFPDKTWKIPLYWHYLDIELPFYKQFTREIIQFAKHKLDQ